MRCAQLIYRCASRSAVKRATRGPLTALHQHRTYIVHHTTTSNTARTGLASTTQLFAPRPRWIESRQFSNETSTTDINTESASQGQRKRTQRNYNNNNNNHNDNESAVSIFKVNDEAEFDNYQLESKTVGQLIAIMSTLWVKFSNGAKALNIWNNVLYPRTGLNKMTVEEALELVPVLADLKQYNHALDIYEQVLRPALLAQRLRVSQLNSTGPHTYKRGNYSRPAALPSLFHAFFTRVAMSEFPTPQQLGGEATSGAERARTAEEVQRDAERLLELWNWVWEEDQATKPTARYLTRDVSPARETDKEIAEMPSKQLLNVTRVKEQTTITLSAHKAAKLLSNARALEQIMEYIPQRNWRIVRNTYEILIKEAVTQGKEGALKALEQFQTLCRFGVTSPALCKAVVMALREHNRHHEIVQLAHQIATGELELGKMVPDRATLNAIIHACHETHQSRAAIDVWHWFVRQYEQRSESRAVSAVLESDATESGESEVVVSDKDKDKDALLKPYFSTIEKYLSLISTGSSPVSEAERLLKTIKTHFAPVSASTYAGMLRIAARANNIEFAIALWADMKQQAKQQSGVESSAAQENDQGYNDAVVYASMAQTLLLLLGKQLMPEAWHTRAEMILGELTQLFNTNITHNFVNAFIDQTLRRNYHPETVLDMVTSFIKITGKYPTDVPILRELFDQAAKLGRAELALALFATLKDAQSNGSEEGGESQSEMYSTLLIAYARSGELDKLARVWALMKQQNIVPNESGFTAVLDGYKDKDAEKAAELIIQVKSVPAAIYAATLEALLNENKVDKAAEVFSALYSREPNKLQRVSKNVLRRLSTAITKDKTVALRNSVMPHLRAAISF